MVLAQEVEQLGAQTDAGVELRIGARHVGAELDQILGIVVGGEGGANFARGLLLRRRGDGVGQTADGVQDIDGRIVALRAELAGKDEVAVEDGADGIADGLVEIVAFHQDGEETGDGAAAEIPGAFQDFGQQVKDRRGVAFLARRFAGGQADLALGHVLGATGIVGQRFIQMLEQHPWFEVSWLAASDRSEGRTYAEAARWRLKTAIPARIANMTVSPAKPEGAPKIIFAALDAAIARELEPQFAAAGCAVVSNSSALRMQADVPLVIPEVTGHHIRWIDKQSWRSQSGGFVVTNPNCSAIGLVLALAPLHRAFTLETVMAVTMQAVSGAGYPGVASLDILGNVIPYIAKEEEKMEEETQKLLGTLNGSRVDPAPFAMSAQCNRVAVEDGHTESVAVRLKKKAAPEEIISAWNNFRADAQT